MAMEAGTGNVERCKFLVALELLVLFGISNSARVFPYRVREEIDFVWCYVAYLQLCQY